MGRTIVDGEIAVLDEVGRTDFEALQGRARRRRWRAGDIAVTYCVFDLLVVDGTSIMGERLVDRKARLAQLLEPELPYLLYARHVDSSMVEQPVSWLYAHALALQLEGVVGKLADSPYVPGERTQNWFKLKRPGAVPPERFKHKRR
jgi:bifunctional non-homologous end joining protein LigD